MTFFEDLILNIIFLLFPFFFYILFIAYNTNLRKKCPIILDISLVTSVYLIIIYSRYLNRTTLLLLINIPFIIGIYNKRKLTSILIAICIVLFNYAIFDLPLYIVLPEYILYLVLFFIIIKKNKSFEYILNIFTFIKGAILSFELIYLIPHTTKVLILEIFIMLLVFYLIAYLIFKLITWGEDIVSFNSVLNELQKEKELKNSLFRITHEVKNPIAVCKGYLSMMDYNDLDKIKNYHNIIKKEIDRTLDIMDDFSSYNKTNMNFDIMDINILITDVVSTMHSLFREKNIKIEENLKDNELLIMGDYNKLKQAFVNILKNSVEAIKDNGLITITTKNNKNITIYIKDNGCGMNKDDLKKIGDLFYTTKENGTGLGVPLSKEIIKKHDGTLKYESNNIGTTAIITIPRYNYKK